MSKFSKIECYSTINNVDKKKVSELKTSMKNHGWIGMPILYTELELITGSHRLVALQELSEEYDNGDFDTETEKILEEIFLKADVCEDVTDIVNDYCSDGEDIQFDNLEPIFKGTWVEKYKNEIIEW